jgi:hypothetical protein
MSYCNDLPHESQSTSGSASTPSPFQNDPENGSVAGSGSNSPDLCAAGLKK